MYPSLPDVKAGDQDEVKNLPHKSWLMEGFPFTFLCFSAQYGGGVVIEVVGQNT